MEKLADMELIDRTQAGDHLAFAALADRHYMTVYRYAFRWCRSREDAEDITQEVFMKLAGKMHLFDTAIVVHHLAVPGDRQLCQGLCQKKQEVDEATGHRIHLRTIL